MASLKKFDAVSSRQVFFEQTITRLVTYWAVNEAVKNVDIELLDLEWENILTTIMLSLELPAMWEETKDLMEAFHKYMIRQGRTEVWRTLLGKAIDVSRQRQDIHGEATLTAFLAENCITASNRKEGVSLYRQAIRLARVSGNRIEKARIFVNLGFHFIEEGYGRRSEVLLTHALRIYEDLNHQQGIADSKRNLGTLYLRQGKWDAAEKHLKKVVQMSEQMNDDYKVVVVYCNLGVLFLERTQGKKALPYTQKALLYTQKAIDKAELIGAKPILGTLYMNLGLAHLLEDNVAQAEHYLRKAEPIFQASKDAFSLAQVVRHIGDVYEAKKDYAQACEYYELSIKRFQAMGNWSFEIESLTPLAYCQILSDDFANALKTIARAETLLVKYDAYWQERYSSRLEKLYDVLRDKKVLTSKSDNQTQVFDEQ